MRTEKLKVDLIQKILFTDDTKTLNKIKDVIESEERPVKISAPVKAALKKSLKSLKEGKTISHEEVFKRIDKWLKEK
jgi:hypothetical protein